MNNQEVNNKYKNYNKYYVPNDYINQNYQYKMNGDYIYIITNRNCYTNYNTQYCDCNYYNWKQNVMSATYSCNTNNNNPTIPFESITNDINYSDHIVQKYTNDYTIYLMIFIIGLILASWLTKERKHY